MLRRIDRIQMAMPAYNPAGWTGILGAMERGSDRIAHLNCTRHRLQVGGSFVEILIPDGPGIVADTVEARGAHLFSAGASTDDFDGLRTHLQQQGLQPVEEGGQLYMSPEDTGGHGFRIVITPEQSVEPVGQLDFLYEVTLLVADAPAVSDEFARIFALNADHFVPIGSDKFGYSGYLTLFQPDQLHRFEIITPTDLSKTMGRFFARQGEVMYMAFGETGRLGEIEKDLEAAALGYTVDRPEGQTNPDQLWLHPATLGGMMLGCSRRTRAWHWSGSPERVEDID